MSIQIALEHSQVDKSLSWDQVYTKKKKKESVYFKKCQNIFRVTLSSNKRREVVHMAMGLYSILKRNK